MKSCTRLVITRVAGAHVASLWERCSVSWKRLAVLPACRKQRCGVERICSQTLVWGVASVVNRWRPNDTDVRYIRHTRDLIRVLRHDALGLNYMTHAESNRHPLVSERLLLGPN